MRGSSASQTANIAWLRCGPAKATTIIASSSEGMESRVSRIWFITAERRPWVDPAITPSTRPNSVAPRVTTKRRRRWAPRRSAVGSAHRGRGHRFPERRRLRHSATTTAATAGSRGTAGRCRRGEPAAEDAEQQQARAAVQTDHRRGVAIELTPYGAQRAGRTLFQINAIVGHMNPF